MEDSHHRAAKVTGDPLSFYQPRSTLYIIGGSSMLKGFKKIRCLLSRANLH